MPTESQMKVIKMIEDNLQLKFEGKTTAEARKFISENISESKNVSDHYKELIRSNFGGYKRVWELLNK